ncbi:ParA family protein [Corallococcus sp. CA054B]|uniref:ParA family protein n=1 Tax=Corallococcus sp. CA054B TaxID=2316734 RepID=UPI000EA0387B|nr:ParA family protein [Corallococcus sp. CA054B]RKG66720.1 ParA family protein [Corallococcus sp. CA054B]
MTNNAPRTGASLPRYAVWNNKGGVGKTFVTFVVAAEYAEQHPDKIVVVIDMCPQANVSEILLGGNGTGSAQLSRLLANSPRQTVGGYFDQRVIQPHTRTGTESSFLVDVAQINTRLPRNMRLVAGDPSLEVQTQAMNQIAGQTLPASAWANVHRWLLDMVSAISTQMPSAVFFIDCNPSFSAYTEIALLAADRIIVPCTADGSSARAIDNIGQLLYGIGVPAQYQGASFAAQARRYGITIPSLHLIPLNRSTQYDKKASKAFGAMYGEIQNRVGNLRNQIPGSFSLANPAALFLEIPDAHSVSVVASHEGIPLSKITLGAHTVHGVTTQVNDEPLDRYRVALRKLVSLL